MTECFNNGINMSVDWCMEISLIHVFPGLTRQRDMQKVIPRSRWGG